MIVGNQRVDSERLRILFDSERAPTAHYSTTYLLLGIQLKIRVSGVQFPPWPPKNPLFFLALQFELFLRRRQLCQDCAMKFQVVGVDREMPHG
jgi:hypothetical protein